MKSKLCVKLCKAVAALACGVSCALFAGCAKTQTVEGEMYYVQYGTEYGVKVNVQVQADKKGDRIRKVTVEDSDYVSASPAMGNWDPKVWNDGLPTLLNAYRGQYVADVLALDVATNGGIPLVGTDDGFVNYGDNLIITGATLGSGRLLIAVQNALGSLDGYKVAEGEYGYNEYNTDYGARVRVVLKNGVVKKVTVLSSGYTNATAQGWEDVRLWNEAEDGILAAYEGRTVDGIMSLTATIKGQSGATDNTVSDPSLLVTNATKSSARLLLAVQNALSNV